MFNRRRFLGFIVTTMLVGRGSCAFSANASMRVGTLPVVSSRTAYDIYRPLLTYLEKELDLTTLLETPPNFKGMFKRIRENGFDLLLSPPHIARLAQRKFGWHPLAMCLPEHNSVLMVMAENGPTNLEELRGNTVAVLDNSALVVLIMMDALAHKGLVANRDFRVIETRSYESSQIAVRQGVAQAMVARSQGFIDTEERDRMKVLFEAGALPGYVFIAAPTMPLNLQRQLRAQLLSFGQRPEAKPFLQKLGYDALSAVSEDAMQRLDPYLEATEAHLK